MVSKADKMKTIFKNMFSLKADVASHEEIRERLLQGGKITGTNMCVLICAMVIASVGLNVSSTAVIIGAMLISPLMGSILAMAYGLVTNDLKLQLRILPLQKDMPVYFPKEADTRPGEQVNQVTIINP